MKITIEEDKDKKIIYDNITQYIIIATDGKKEYRSYSGTYNYLIGQLYYYLQFIKEQWRNSIGNS
jgi:hypothetical protein